MYVFPPKLQDLTSWAPIGGVSNAKEMWEISAPPDHSLYWSLVLSFIIASPENSDWLERLLGSQDEMKETMRRKNVPLHKLDSKSIKKQVMSFNPFKNQHSFYFNKDLIDVFRLFKLRLNRTAGGMRRNSKEWGDDTKLKAATKMLKCCIQVYETDSNGKKLQPTLYPSAHDVAVLCLFKHSGVVKKYTFEPSPGQVSDHKIINTFGFGMNLHFAVSLRRDALGHILRRTDIIQETIQRIQREFTDDENFLVSLLSKDLKIKTVPSIYASPYIAWKLASAGFITDPCSLDRNGLSAFYYCMGLDSTLLLHVLYDYASNSFEHSDKTTRNPDPEILRALTRISHALQNDYSKSNGFSTLGCKKDTALKCFDEISRFNEYQLLVVKRIAEQQETTPQISQPDDVGNIMRRKRIITSFLNLYPSHFYYPNVNQARGQTDESKFSKFQNFIQHREYYENLDNYTCLLFFDNFLYLDLSADLMNSAVQNLFLTVFGYHLFPKCVHGVHCTKHAPTTEECALYAIPFHFRFNFLDSAKVVLQELEHPLARDASKSPEQGSRKKCDPNSVLGQVTAGLKILPEIKDEFLVCRLKDYLDTAGSTAFHDTDMKGVWVLERTLQVVGETLKTSESSSVIGHLLCSCLGGVVEEFFKIRNQILSHYRPRMMNGKINLEKKILRFREIQDVIKEVHSLVEPVMVSQSLRIMNYMVERGLHASKDIDPTLAENMEREYNGKTRLLREIYIRNTRKYKCLANSLLNYIEKEAGSGKCHKFRKIGQFSALKFLFVFLASQFDEENRNKIILILQDLDRLSKNFESKANATKPNEIEISTSESREIFRVVSDLRKITDCVFSDVKAEPRKVIDQSVKTFFSDARKFNWFTDEEMTLIKEKISEYLQSSRKAKESLKEFLDNEKQLSELEAQQLLDAIFASQKEKSCILANLSAHRQTALGALNSVKRDEQNVFTRKGQEDDLDCLLRFSDSEEGVHLLLKMDFQDELHRKVLKFLNRKVEFLLDRIGHLKSILIDEDEEILALWNWGKSEAIKTHTRFLMCQRYRREKDVRASIEMLLFDCMNILTKKKSLSRLWSKANDLFSGASLRNILSHGSTILEIVGGCLDKDDLPSHFIDKMLELIEDGDTLQALTALWEKAKTTDLKQFESMLEADDASLRKWRKRPGTTSEWKDYLSLLPLT